jgi:hypothetical protein
MHRAADIMPAWDRQQNRRAHVARLFFDLEGSSLVPDGPKMRAPTLLLLHGGPGSTEKGGNPGASRGKAWSCPLARACGMSAERFNPPFVAKCRLPMMPRHPYPCVASSLSNSSRRYPQRVKSATRVAAGSPTHTPQNDISGRTSRESGEYGRVHDQSVGQ